MISINHGLRPVFEPGDLVQHRRYGYRGVVVERDESCLADDAWYQKNQTQPDRQQPWYHVLVNHSSICTNATAENLALDTSGLPVEHPLLAQFFSAFQEGAYVRNDAQWPR
ncbi:MAG: heat shock protein HspQ [Planctomycetales bacterium]|nr:heat shock protein HspQ [Planctomycetales bacterium]